MPNFKQALIVNKALAMSIGKTAAQCAHAAVQAVLDVPCEEVTEWMRNGMTKIVLEAPDEETLKTLWAKAKEEGLSAYLVHDEGRTEVPPGSITVLGIGPGVIDSVTGHLPLLKG